MTEKSPNQTTPQRSGYQGIRPWFREKYREFIDQELVSAYSEFVKSLSHDELGLRVQILEQGQFTQPELAEHLEKRDPIGQSWAEVLYEGTYESLSTDEQRRARENPKYLIERTVQEFRRAISRRNRIVTT
jgi:hypothetical protein